jgi:hypothetical protein
MAEVQQVTNFPWQPQCTIRGNLAIGNLHNALLQWLRSDLGVRNPEAFWHESVFGGAADA